ncbi:MAG: ZIP family metal transporter [Clostridiales bacterium]|nr:ZIP family metal transporter [Clostridiales bacterium]
MDEMFLWVVLVATITGLGGTGIGGIIGALIKRDSTKIVSLLLSFTAGIMLAIVCFTLIPEALFPEGQESAGLLAVVLGTAGGYGLVALLNRCIDERTYPELFKNDSTHPKTADNLDELIHSDLLEKHRGDSPRLFVAGLIMAAAIALHNLPEGMVIGAAYIGQDIDEIWTGNGFIMALLIGLHDIPEGMAISVPLIAGGMKRGKALLITALSGLPIVIGAILGYLIGSMGPLTHTLSLSFASGAMLYVVLGELLPESILMWRSKLPALGAFIGVLMGVIIIYV